MASVEWQGTVAAAVSGPGGILGIANTARSGEIWFFLVSTLQGTRSQQSEKHWRILARHLAWWKYGQVLWCEDVILPEQHTFSSTLLHLLFYHEFQTTLPPVHIVN